MNELTNPCAEAAILSHTNDICSTEGHENQSVQQDESVETYEAGGGKNSYHGIVYQLRMLIFFILRGLANSYSFSLATDMKNAEKFDDVVLRIKKNLSGGHVYRLLQAKHRAGTNPGKITRSALLSESTKGDFSLRSYFQSYLKLKPKFNIGQDEIMDIIICTNAGFKENDSFGDSKLGDAFEPKENVDEIFEKNLLKFKKEFKGKEILISVLKKPLMGIVPTDEDIELFLDKLSFAMKQDGNNSLEEKNKQMFNEQCKIKDSEFVFPLFEKKISDWMTSFEGNYFSARMAKTFIQTLKDKFGEFSIGLQDPVWNFIGRERELEGIEIARRNGVKIIVISGLGGMGKSELTRRYIQKNSDVFKRIVWVTADSQGSLLSSLHKLANRFGIDVEEQQTKTITEEVYTYFENQDSVFVFDNVERVNLETEGNHFIKEFLPLGSKSPFVILTSRCQWNWDDVHNLSLTEVTDNDAVNFIKSNLPVETHSSNESIKMLAVRLQNFPLALQQAVAYIKKKNMYSALQGNKYCIDDYLIAFDKETKEVLNFQISNSIRNGYEETTFTTWSITLNMIKEIPCGETADKILRLISYFAPDYIKLKDITIYFDGVKLEEVTESLYFLRDISVIVLHGDKIRIHRLVQNVIKLKIRDLGKEKETLRWILNCAKKIDVEHRILLWESLEEHKDLQIEYSHLPSKIIRRLKNLIRYDQSYTFGKRCLSVLMEICDPMDENLLATIESLADVTYQRGKYREACQLQETIYEMRKKSTAGEDLTISNAKYDVAKSRSQLGDYATALKMYEEVLKKRNEVLGEDHPSTLTVHYEIARSIFNLGDYVKALKLHGVVFEKRKNILGKDHASTLNSRYEIARCCSNLGDYSKALLIFEDVFEMRKNVLGIDHLSTLSAKFEIASCNSKLGKFRKALKMQKEVFEKRSEILGEDNPFTLTAKQEVASSHSNLGEYVKALKIHKEVLEMKKEVFGENHPSALNSKYALARCTSNLGDYSKALKIFENVFEKRNVLSGENHPATLNARYQMAACKTKLGNYTEALRIYDEVFEMRKSSLGEDHPFTLNTRQEVGSCKSLLGNKLEALEIYKEVFEKKVKIMGKNHPSSLLTRYKIAISISDLGNYSNALELHYAILDKRIEILGEHHPSTLNSRFEIAKCYSKLENYEKALRTFEEVFEKRKELLGESHPFTLNALKATEKCRSNIKIKMAKTQV